MNIKSNLWKIYLYKFLRDFWLIMAVIVPFYKANGLSATQILIVQAVFSTSLFIAEIPSGYFADVVGRKKMLAMGAFFLTIGLTIYSLSHSFWFFALAEFVLGFGYSMCTGTESALIYDTLLQVKEEGRYQKLEGTAEFFSRIGTGVSSVAGALLAMVSLTMPFYINIATGTIMFFLALLLIEPERIKLASPSPLKDIINITKYSLTHIKIAYIILFFSIAMSSGLVSIWGYMLFIQKTQMSIMTFGIYFAVFQLASAIGAKLSHRIEAGIGHKNAIYPLYLIPAVVLCFAVANSKWALALTLVHAFAWGYSTPWFFTLLNKLIKSDIRATVISVMNMTSRILFVIIGPGFGYVCEHYSISLAFVLLSIWFLIMSTFAGWLFKKNKVC